MSYENGKIPVLHEVDLEVQRGSLVAICGPSGCGKSTLLHLIAGLDQPTRGQVLHDGQSLHRDRDLTLLLRSRIGLVFQLHNLIADLTLTENCLIPAIAAGLPKGEARLRLARLTTATGLQHRLGNRIQDLSGGERQRTALCRALMNDPQLILADEPTGALDEDSREQVFALLVDLVRSAGRTLIMATHDRSLADRCDRVVEMKDGRILS
ncbi:MAG: ABC transporter ATP-binding protein [Verrucomicrobia bacterium]|nr:ABC transporter ATP-binding protein [Verrucomicrobiota bacterium]